MNVPGKRRSALFDLVAEHNPFYLLSAACMLAGCLALTNSLSWSPIKVRQLLVLIATLNLYEVALLAAALYLVVRRRLKRDGRMLLVLQAVFLLDFTFLNSEILAARYSVGLLVNGWLFLLAVVKLGVVLYVLKPNLPRHQVGFIFLQLLVLFALPCVFNYFPAEKVLVRHLYAAWWVIGLLPAAYELLFHLDRSGQDLPLPAIPGQAVPKAAYLALPWVSLLMHLGILHWVYDARFYGACAAPVLLGLTLVITRAAPSAFAPRRDLAIIRFLLPAAALLVSLNNPHVLGFTLAGGKLVLTPLKLAMVGAYLTWVYCFLMSYALWMLAAGAVAALAWALGPTPAQVAHWAAAGWHWTAGGWHWAMTQGQKLIPRTARAWGVLAVIASFTFLVVGFLFSLRKAAARETESDTPLA